MKQKHAPSLMFLPMQGFLYSRVRDLLIDKIRIEGREQVHQTILSGILNYDTIHNPVSRRSCMLLTAIHTKRALSGIVDKCLSYLVGDYNPTKDDEKNIISGAESPWLEIIIHGYLHLLGEAITHEEEEAPHTGAGGAGAGGAGAGDPGGGSGDSSDLVGPPVSSGLKEIDGQVYEVVYDKFGNFLVIKKHSEGYSP